MITHTEHGVDTNKTKQSPIVILGLVFFALVTLGVVILNNWQDFPNVLLKSSVFWFIFTEIIALVILKIKAKYFKKSIRIIIATIPIIVLIVTYIIFNSIYYVTLPCSECGKDKNLDDCYFNLDKANSRGLVNIPSSTVKNVLKTIHTGPTANAGYVDCRYVLK